jgi:DinB family protein
VTTAEVLSDAFSRVREGVHWAVGELSAEQLAARLDEAANSIAWLCWHLSRVQDDHLADAFVRLVSVISDGLQHAGQAAFVRGILLR